jgi:anti-sigma-K factor RskA
VLLANPTPVPPPIVVVLAPTGTTPGRDAAGDAGREHQRRPLDLVTRAIVPVSIQPDRALELWAVPTAGAPRSLGLLPGGSGTVALRGKVLAGSRHPRGHARAGRRLADRQPTGPIVYAGKFSL